RAGETGREAELSGHGGVGRETIEAAGERGGDEVRLDLRVVHAVAAAHGQVRVAHRMPSESDARLEVVLGIGECLPVVTQAGIDGEVVIDVNAVLHEAGVEPLRKFVAADAEVDGLRVLLDIAERELAERRSGRALEGERAEGRRARLAAGAAGR